MNQPVKIIARLGMDFFGGAHVEPLIKCWAHMISSSSLSEAVVVLQSENPVHLLAAVVMAFELMNSFRKH